MWHIRPIRLALALWLIGVNCGSAIDLRLPAIDPSGRRIFLPSPNATHIDFDKDKEWLRRLWPTPAYQAPETPPPCGSLQDQLAVPLPREVPAEKKHNWPHHDKLLSKLMPPPLSWVEDGQLQVSPRRTVARVGSEVILVGGVCTDPGILITGELIEWYLDRQSVGQFADAGSQYIGPIHHLVHGRATYATPDYVLSLGAPGQRVLTRGTKAAEDDLLLLAGQTWVSLYSDREGTSYVTTLAPRMPDCMARRVESVIHWVDSEWDFPPPATAQSGTTHNLVTTVRRFQTGEPIGGYLVRYEIVSGDGLFTTTQDKIAEVTTGADGVAAVGITAPADYQGTTQVKVSVTRPAAPGRAVMVLGNGETTITWNAVQLDLTLTGPPQAPLDDEVVYTATVRNLGTAPSRPLVLRDALPDQLRFVSSDPATAPYGHQLEWPLPALQPQGSHVVHIRCKTIGIGRFDHCVELTEADGVPRDYCVSTVVDAPPLEVQVDGQSPSAIGGADDVSYRGA